MTTTRARKAALDLEQFHALVYEALETETGGLEIYRTALKCVRNDDLREEWQKYLEETEEHVERIRSVCEALELDPDAETPGRAVVRTIGKALVSAMKLALEADRAAAEIVAAECVTLAETKDHHNWELLGAVLKDKTASRDLPDLVREVQEQTEDEEDEHLYHSRGWARELRLAALGLPAVLPPPEEKHDVKTAIGAERAKQSRAKDVSKGKAKAKSQE